jgi:hypothetical protein
MCLVLVMGTANAALIGMIKPTPSDPYYADFTANSLSISYAYNSTTQVGTLIAQNSGIAPLPVAESYESGSASAGTGSLNGGTGFNSQSLLGSYVLTASIKLIGGVWSVTGGSFTMKGSLPGVSTATTDLLLQGNLLAGGDGPSGTWGYATGSKLFEFLYTVDTGNTANGNLAIRKDFATGNPLGTTIHGGIFLNLNQVFTQGLATSWANVGTADTFVPEPAAYPWGAAGLAGLSLIYVRRKPAFLA